MGVPLSRLQGRPVPLTFEWQGTKVTALMQSPWTQDDVAAVLAVEQADGDGCPGCGADLQVTTDPAHQFDWVAETVRCHNCKARADEIDGHENRAGLLVRSRFEPDERVAR